jgi:tetratricopeptide (TPR) repeat protein
LLYERRVDSASVMRAARELFAARQYPGVVAACQDALLDDPANTHLRLLRARALMALRRDTEAQNEISEALRHEPGIATAYRLLGELAARRDENESAKIFLKEALRLDPDDVDAHEWLGLVQAMVRSTAAADKLPAAAAAVGHLLPSAPYAPRDAASAKRLPRAVGTLPPPEMQRSTLSQLPMASGFGNYLVETGVLSPVQLRAALAYKKSTGVRLGAAAVVLGFASELKIEWASLAYHGQHRRASM